MSSTKFHSYSAGQKLPAFMELEVSEIQKSPPLDIIVSQLNPIHTITSYVCRFHLNSIPHLSLGLPGAKWSLALLLSRFRFLRALFFFLISTKRATNYETSCNVIFSILVTPLLFLGANNLSTLSSYTLNLCYFFWIRDISHPYCKPDLKPWLYSH